MGANQSRTRKLTVENDDPTSVIKVSDDVVQRLKNNQEVRAAPPQAVVPQQPVVGSMVAPPPYLYEPSITTVQLRQSNVSDLKKNDEYWQNRLKNLQSNHKKINEILEQEYKNAVEELGGNKKSSVNNKLVPPCQDYKEAVKECYKDHYKQPMRCARVVQAFQQCVDEKRASVIAERG